ncbi:MAG: hypothetical protein IT204_12755 [Fimbriimonadaceae bacterium]|nr:hypothetical protein [Fimbriimonadaceae bacterium]
MPALLLTLLLADPAVSLVTTPRLLLAGQPVTVQVRYELPAAGEFKLNLELKDPAETVVAADHRMVRGSGVAEFQLTVPGDLKPAEARFAVWVGTDWNRSPVGVLRTRLLPVVSGQTAATVAALQRDGQAARQAWQAARRPGGLVGLYRHAAAPLPAELLAGLQADLATREVGTVVLSGEQLANPWCLDDRPLDALVLCGATHLPAAAARGIEAFREAGGHLISLGGPAWEQPQYLHQGRWLDADAYRQAVAASVVCRVFRDFSRAPAGDWARASGAPQEAVTVSWDPAGSPASAGSLKFALERFLNWDTFAVPQLAPPFGGGESWTCFWAKGGPGTRQLSVEWRERDLSRWIAVVPLSPEWRPYALPPSAFRYWYDSRVAGRGEGADEFRPTQAAELHFGLALTHTTQVSPGAHTFWIDQLATAPPPAGVDREALRGVTPVWPKIEGCAPAYKLYPVTNLASLAVTPGQVIAEPLQPPRPNALLSPHARPGGSGLHKDRAYRYQPLLDCRDAAGRTVGAAAAQLVYAQGGDVLTVPVRDAAFFTPAVQRWCGALTARLLAGAWLTEGGAAWYTTWGNEPVPVGATVTHHGRGELRLQVVASVAGADGRSLWQQTWPVTLAAGQTRTVEAPWPAPATGGPFRVTVLLRQGERVLDRLDHEVRTVRWPTQPQYVTRERGTLRLAGRPWHAHGVNYMPSSGIGLEDSATFELWLSPRSYDPVIVERDLSDLAALGLNSVSIFQYHDSLAGRNLLDLLLRCADKGLRVNLSLRPGTPLEFPWDLVREMITAHRLDRCDTIFAYDLAWEPHWRWHRDRQAFDELWAQWITARYGGLPQAETAWGCAAPRRADGQVTNPLDEQVRRDGPQTALVIDYRRFQNGLLRQWYGRARELVRSIDPHHAVSFRMSLAGDPTADPAVMGYDFAGLRDAVDLMEPEAYGRIGAWEQVKPGWFTVAYARACAPEVPVIWAEFGQQVWGGDGPRPEALAAQAQFYDDFYKLADLTAVSGTYCWWWPGGYRVNENSDFGIINPDRSLRPVSAVIQRWAPILTRGREIPPPTTWIEIDPSSTARGLYGWYETHREAFWKAVEAGQTPGLRLRGEW